jgi:hypothetical protein
MATTRLRFKPDFPWTLVHWTGPKDPVSYTCSLCRSAIDEREVPLRLMGPVRYAVFCDDCVDRWIARGRW